MRIEELRAKNMSELKQELLALRKEQFSLRMQKETQQLDKTHNLAAVRKMIARVKTVLTEKMDG